MAMTGVKARRGDGAEVKLDSAFYRLRDRFFGSRVGTRALRAVTFTFGRRGMALFQSFSFGCVVWWENGCVQPSGPRKAFRTSAVSRVQRSRSAAYAHAMADPPEQLGPARVRTTQPRRTGGTVRGGLSGRRRCDACGHTASGL